MLRDSQGLRRHTTDPRPGHTPRSRRLDLGVRATGRTGQRVVVTRSHRECCGSPLLHNRSFGDTHARPKFHGSVVHRPALLSPRLLAAGGTASGFDRVRPFGLRPDPGRGSAPCDPSSFSAGSVQPRLLRLAQPRCPRLALSPCAAASLHPPVGHRQCPLRHPRFARTLAPLAVRSLGSFAQGRPASRWSPLRRQGRRQVSASTAGPPTLGRKLLDVTA